MSKKTALFSHRRQALVAAKPAQIQGRLHLIPQTSAPQPRLSKDREPVECSPVSSTLMERVHGPWSRLASANCGPSFRWLPSWAWPLQLPALPSLFSRAQKTS